jgi:hypothetical protein
MFDAGGMNMNARLWLHMLRQWLERPGTAEENVDRQQALHERSQLELRKAQATAWYFSPPY